MERPVEAPGGTKRLSADRLPDMARAIDLLRVTDEGVGLCWLESRIVVQQIGSRVLATMTVQVGAHHAATVVGDRRVDDVHTGDLLDQRGKLASSAAADGRGG